MGIWHKRKRKYIQKRRQRSSLLRGETELLQFLSTLAILHQDELKNRLIFTQFFDSSWFKSAYSSNRPVTKKLARQGIETILTPKKQRRPLPSLLYKTFFYGKWYMLLIGAVVVVVCCETMTSGHAAGATVNPRG